MRFLARMTKYAIRFTKEAKKDTEKLSPKLRKKLKEILENVILEDPESGKKLLADLKGFYSIRLSYKDRIIYSIDKQEKIILIHKTKTHYGD